MHLTLSFNLCLLFMVQLVINFSYTTLLYSLPLIALFPASLARCNFGFHHSIRLSAAFPVSKSYQTLQSAFTPIEFLILSQPAFRRSKFSILGS